MRSRSGSHVDHFSFSANVSFRTLLQVDVSPHEVNAAVLPKVATSRAPATAAVSILRVVLTKFMGVSPYGKRGAGSSSARSLVAENARRIAQRRVFGVLRREHVVGASGLLVRSGLGQVE